VFCLSVFFFAGLLLYYFYQSCIIAHHSLRYYRHYAFAVLFVRSLSTPPCNLSLMACFADTNVLQGSVATYARCGGNFGIHLTANLLGIFQWKKFLNRIRFDRTMATSPWLRFFGPPCMFSRFHELRRQKISRVAFSLHNTARDYQIILTCISLGRKNPHLG